MQRWLRRADWDVEGVRDDVRDYVIEYLGGRRGVLIVDDTEFLKKGVRSAGVQRQYSGTAQQAMAIRARALEAGVPFAWVTADEAYGQVKYLRVWLEDRSDVHVLSTRSATP